MLVFVSPCFRVQPIFEWLFEVEDGASDADDSGRISFSLEYEMNSNLQETYGSVENRVVARLHIQQDDVNSIVPVVKVRRGGLRIRDAS